MQKLRQSLSPGHKRKFLVIIDETTECLRALYYAARRATSTNGSLVMLYCISQDSDATQWAHMAELMREEMMEEARTVLNTHKSEVQGKFNFTPESVIVIGDPVQEILKLIEEDQDIALLVLAASSSRDGPGPLVNAIVNKRSSEFNTPITIVPETLSDEVIDSLA